MCLFDTHLFSSSVYMQEDAIACFIVVALHMLFAQAKKCVQTNIQSSLSLLKTD